MSMGLAGMLKEVSKTLEPNKKFIEKVNVFIKDLNELLSSKKIDAICVPGGSVAKGTLIKDDHDVDLFVRFNFEKYENKDISKELEKALKGNFDYEKVHGSRDYFQITDKKLVFELVPVLYIDNYKMAKNVTDMSPFHVEWVKKNSNNKLLSEIRLLKQFCKANDLYGAESYIGGFSGHIIDIMTIHYGSFLDVLNASQDWKDKEIIDIEHHLDDPFNDLNSSKVLSPLIIVDPVQPDRNAAAALSEEKFDLFKEKAKEFLKNPSKEFFKKKKFDLNKIKKEKANDEKIIIFYAKALPGKTDVVGAKLVKVYEYLAKELKRNDFKTKRKGWNWDKEKDVCFYFFIDGKELEKELEKRGPPTKILEDSTRFRAKHDNVYVRNGRFYAKVERKFIKPLQIANFLIKETYVKERVKAIKKEVL
ncbi:hypothetical protein C0585_06640 [Candidatus Woesearchaeota archaeon]|nr:MAG: hypothetical protein C0585_06640 [Candidatus Woesearchaeota archaeon]